MRTGRKYVAALAVMGALVAAGVLASRLGGRHPERKPPRLVLLYAPCTVNRSFLAPYDPSVTYTPRLEQLATRARVFLRHHTEAGKSGVAYAALLSGTHAMDHGVFFHPAPLPDSLYLVTEFFRDAGYEPFFWNRQLMASPDLNYAQGVPPENIFAKPLTVREPALDRLLERLASDERAKAFVFTNFSVTHAPYSALHRVSFCRLYPRECAGLEEADFERFVPLISGNDELLDFVYDFDRACERHGLSPDDVRTMGAVVKVLYKSNIHHLDGLFGLVLDRIRAHGLMEESLIVFTADHGEVLQRENAAYKWTHGFALDPEVIQVPLLVSGPGIEPGRYEEVTRSIDVFPTLAGLVGKPLDRGRVSGVDLSNVLLGEEPAPSLPAFMHTALPHESELATGYASLVSRFPRQDASLMWVGVREGDLVYELTREGGNPGAKVYDWTADPHEIENLYDPDDRAQAAMFRRLVEYHERLIEARAASTGKDGGRMTTERQEEILRKLGYLHPS